VTVAIVGPDPPPAVVALGRLPGVDVVGRVDDVACWYERARVAVVPVRRGAGTRIKLLEALAHARPVVSTTVGAEGLTLQPGCDGLLVADDPRAFAAACRHLLADDTDARRLAGAGREWVARNATIDVVADHIDGLFRELIVVG
jgi:glycosyltransferase involved in cell wall biosynthesis